MSDKDRQQVIHEVQGALRDALSALQNLAVLLRSLRVGPRPIAAVLTEIRLTVAAVPSAIGTMLWALDLEDEPAARQLGFFADSCTVEIVQALQRAESTALEARPRLALESEVQRLIPRLDAVRGQVELLILLGAPTIDLDAAELLDAALAPPSRSGFIGPVVQLSSEPLRRGLHSVQVNPQVFSRLLLLALGHIHGDGGAWHHAQVGLRVASSDSHLRLTLDPQPVRGDVILLRPLLPVPSTRPVLEMFCRRQGACGVLDSGASAWIELPLA